MENTKCILLCGEKSSRWKSPNGSLKHLTEIDDQPLLDVTIKHLRSAGIQDIVILGRDERLRRDGVKYFALDGAQPQNNENKIYITIPHWNKKGNTIILYGDVWLSALAMSELTSINEDKIRFVGRNTASKHTLGPHPEIFGFNFSSKSQNKIKQTLLLDKNEDVSGWILYEQLTDTLDDAGSGDVVFSHIDDFSEDFDYYEYFITWLKRKNDKTIKADRNFVRQHNLAKKWQKRTWFFSTIALTIGLIAGQIMS